MSSRSPEQPAIYHVAFDADWEKAKADGSYRISTRGVDLDRVGFIHCSFRDQVDAIVEMLYGDVAAPLVVLVIDPERALAEVRVENLEGGDVLYPHVYGPLPVEAVVDTIPVSRANGALTVTFPE
jgi:glutathione S-transferase